MRATAFVQARTGSTRLPGKVLLDLEGKTMLERVVERVQKSARIDEVVVVTTMSRQDLPIVKLCASLELRVYCGSEDDVLDRFYQAGRLLGLTHVVRVTADCPLLDPRIVTDVVDLHLCTGSDYCSNVLVERFPDGQDVEVFTMEALARAWREATLASEREHVTPYLRGHPELFRQSSLECPRDLSSLRWTIDNQEDYEFTKQVYAALLPIDRYFGMDRVLDLLARHPELAKSNAHIGRNEGYVKSLKEDREVRRPNE
jgi:spore coat polysaccharide biosynthesis protein SpsF (cytidylyltransferase family)